MPAVETPAIDATTSQAEDKDVARIVTTMSAKAIELQERGVTPEQIREILRAERDGEFARIISMCDSAGIASDPAMEALAVQYEAACGDSSTPASDAFRNALMQSIANLRARATSEVQTQQATVTQQATQTQETQAQAATPATAAPAQETTAQPQQDVSVAAQLPPIPAAGTPERAAEVAALIKAAEAAANKPVLGEKTKDVVDERTAAALAQNQR